ncbi:helix-turn-helix domain-containing protein [Streptomyces erythrochromogenes]|uniref:helix-turn-helix domain-containing protein n=1 Tax=Streptomyces erythrochromogenes TaxID=285574 RepID=UPI00386AB0B3|nr:helix-turn-helix domain-containing protein [Streptomyces erythrochromogenes]
MSSPLRDLREKLGLTLDDIAERSQIHKSQLSRFERGQCGLSVDALHRLAEALGLTALAEQLAPYVKGAAA